MNHKYALALSLAGALFLSGNATADIKDDVHIQSNANATQLDIDSRTFNAIKGFFEEGFPPASVMLHAISMGMAIDDVTYLAVKSNVSRAKEFYDTARSLLPSLPGWVCRQSEGNARFVNGYELNELGAQPTIATVAQRFFDENRRLVPFPDWVNGKGHMKASAKELASLVKDARWYQQGRIAPSSTASAPNRPIFVSLYADSKEILVDADLPRIQSGPATFPVVFIFNSGQFRPISQYAADATVSEIANDFFNNRTQLTAVPEWHVGDFHKLAKTSELKALLKAPAKGKVPPERWQQIESELKEGGFSTPLLLSVFGSGEGRVWANQAEKVSVADALGIDQVPVVFFYHNLDRFACGQTATCDDRICEAVIAGGGDSSVCGEQARSAGFTPPGGAGGPQWSPPPVVPLTSAPPISR